MPLELIHSLWAQIVMTVFFFCRWAQPGITLEEDIDNVNATYFQSAVRMQTVPLRWRLTGGFEFNGLHNCQAQTIMMTEMEMMVFFLLRVRGSDHSENEEMKGGEVQLTNIDFRTNRVSLSRDQLLSALRARSISHWKRLMASQMHSGTDHRIPHPSSCPVSQVRLISSAHWAL